MALIARLRLARKTFWWATIDTFDRVIQPPWMERLLLSGRPRRPPQLAATPVSKLYVDVSVIANSDAGTGIQRVVRSIYKDLASVCADGVDIEAVVVNCRRDGYRTLAGERIIGTPEALFFGLDFATDSVVRYREDLEAFSHEGGRIWFLVHDILPITNPNWFTHVSRVKYRRWIRVCSRLADGILCVSPVVADQVKKLLRVRYGIADLPRIDSITLGSNIVSPDCAYEQPMLPTAAGLTEEVFARAAMIVGTLEPRKGHGDVLDAFEILWREGQAFPLIIIGQPGWGTLQLQRRISVHPAVGRLLFWLNDVDDHELYAAYGACRMVIVPSLAEGYGLPLDEALRCNVPVLARDIPVFRRHESGQISYFSEFANPKEIASAVMSSLSEVKPSTTAATLPHWSQTASQVLTALGCVRQS